MEVRNTQASRILDLFILFLKAKVMNMRQIEKSMRDRGHHVTEKTLRRDLECILQRTDCGFETYTHGEIRWWRLKKVDVSGLSLPKTVPDCKKCRDCKRQFIGVKTVDENFSNDKSKTDGKYPYCKVCSGIRSKDDYYKNRKPRRLEKRNGANTSRRQPQGPFTENQTESSRPL